jgi:AcrR family transcriptional regulator
MSTVDPTGGGERAERILDEFTRRAGADGIRAVVMSELARDLGMSTKTLYQEFPNKESLVQAMVRAWIDQLREVQTDQQASKMTAEERLQQGSRELLEWRRTYSDVLWEDLRSDHPEAWALYLQSVRDTRLSAWTRIESAMREDVDHLLAWQLINAVVEHALSPEVRQKTGLDIGDSIDAAITIWARGALAPEGPAR